MASEAAVRRMLYVAVSEGHFSTFARYKSSRR